MDLDAIRAREGAVFVWQGERDLAKRGGGILLEGELDLGLERLRLVGGRWSGLRQGKSPIEASQGPQGDRREEEREYLAAVCAAVQLWVLRCKT
jgi:hypothetical protein